MLIEALEMTSLVVYAHESYLKTSHLVDELAIQESHVSEKEESI